MVISIVMSNYQRVCQHSKEKPSELKIYPAPYTRQITNHLYLHSIMAGHIHSQKSNSPPSASWKPFDAKQPLSWFHVGSSQKDCHISGFSLWDQCCQDLFFGCYLWTYCWFIGTPMIFQLSHWLKKYLMIITNNSHIFVAYFASGNLRVCYWKWPSQNSDVFPWTIVLFQSFPMKIGDFP